MIWFWKGSFNNISQGEIAEIINMRPEERRIILKKRGVLKYKRRKIATRKLKAHDNLNRVNDISELEVQINP